MCQEKSRNLYMSCYTTVLGQYGVSKPTFVLVLGLLKQACLENLTMLAFMWVRFLRVALSISMPNANKP